MACHCVNWATGEPMCIGIIGDGSIARCRTECRLRGMGILCHAGFGDCQGDACSSMGYKWWQLVHATVRLVCPDDGTPDCGFDSIEEFTWIAGACAIVRPISPYTYHYAGELHAMCLPFCTLEITDIGYGIWHRVGEDPLPPGVPLGSPFTSLQCTPSGTALRTPCCYPDPAHPGMTLCAFVTPAECLQRCGQFFEGTIDWANPDNPCALAGDANPCNIHPCCRGPYPHPRAQQDIDGMGGSAEYGLGAHYCRNGTAANCANWAGHPNADARSCYAPESCDKEWLDQNLHCVRGDWAATYRPTNTPPLTKPWIEGSAEIVSEKPERAMRPTGGPQDCTNHYGDVVYPLVERGGAMDAMGSICAIRAVGSRDPGHACREYNAQNVCPVFYGPDGNARFRCEYRVA